MLDPFSVVVEYLLAQATLTALVGERIEAGVYPSEGYNPEPADGDETTGPMILCNTRAGTQGYEQQTHRYSFQFLCYAVDGATAMQTATTLYEVLNDRTGMHITYAEQEQEPQLLQESAADWPYALVFYTIHIRNEG